MRFKIAKATVAANNTVIGKIGDADIGDSRLIETSHELINPSLTHLPCCSSSQPASHSFT